MTILSTRNRLTQALRGADPVLRTLATATVVRATGRGVFFTLVTLYLTRAVHLSVGQVATVLAIANGVGIAGSYLGGHAADHVSARRLLQASFVVEGLALASYTLVGNVTSAVWVAALVAFANKAGGSTLATIVGRGFTGARRVTARAMFRTMGNAGIATGGALAAIALAVGTAQAYRTAMLAACCGHLLAGWTCLRLPASVDAPTSPQAADLPARHPVTDRRYVALTALSGVFVLQFSLAEVALPLWIVGHTQAPHIMVSVLLVINTALVMTLQVPLSRKTHDIPVAARSVLTGSVCLALACAALAATGYAGPAGAVALLVVGELLLSLGEIRQQAGSFGLSYELAPSRRTGVYQGFFATGVALAQTAAPIVIAHTVLAQPNPGWAILAAAFLTAGLLTLLLFQHAVPADPPTSDTPAQRSTTTDAQHTAPARTPQVTPSPAPTPTTLGASDTGRA